MNRDEGCCDINRPHEDILALESRGMRDERLILKAAELFKVFGDPTRLKILSLLAQSECCVYDISKLTNASQSAVSHQLRILRQTRLVRYRREGKEAFYTLDDDHVRSILEIGFEHASEQEGELR